MKCLTATPGVMLAVVAIMLQDFCLWDAHPPLMQGQKLFFYDWPYENLLQIEGLPLKPIGFQVPDCYNHTAPTVSHVPC